MSLPLLCALLVAQAPLDVHGSVDTYYAYNFNRPADGSNFIPGTGTSARRAGEVSLNLAALDVAMKPQPVGFRLILNAGTATEVVHAGEPPGPFLGPQVWHVVQQASAIWEPSPKWHLEAGIYPSHIGLETLPSQANWNYTRANMGELSPYYQAGVMAKYAFTDQLSAQIHFINGWQVIGDNNRAKTVGTQLAWSTGELSFAFNTCLGPELANDNGDWRFFGDLVATWKPTPKLSLAASLDGAIQQQPSASAASWQAAALLARYAFNDSVALAGRAEWFNDPDGAISGTAQQLSEGTATLEVRPSPGLIAKLEGRYDHSTAEVFSTASDPARDQVLVVLGTVAAF